MVMVRDIDFCIFVGESNVGFRKGFIKCGTVRMKRFVFCDLGIYLFNRSVIFCVKMRS